MIRRLIHTSVLCLLFVGFAWVNRAESESVDFELGDSIDFGTQIARIGDLDWSYTLGTSWNKNFSIGGIVGKKNATVIPEVKVAGAVIIPEVKADTRTGARMSGNVSGGTGLEFYVDFQASGLSGGSGSTFQFRPSVETPSGATAVTAGEFFALATSPGMVNNPAFDEDHVDLPSFNAGMNFFFDLDLDSQIEGGLFPIIPYGSTDFNPPRILFDQRGERENSLVNFQFDLDPDDPVLPTFSFLGSPFESEIEFGDTSQYVLDQQLSVDIKDKKNKQDLRLDIGSVQLVNPFGNRDAVVGGGPNLTRAASMDEDNSGLQYSFEMPLLRLGMDLDGIAAFLATGESFTRIEEEIKIANKRIADITADLIDIKYGPELGYRESVEIKPDFDVTLSFDRDVAVKTDNGISVTSSTDGRWNDLPEISLLDDEEVVVTVQFKNLTGEQTKRGSFYLTDYLELTLLEIEDVTILDTFSHSLPPLIQERTSLLGKLLGQIELDVFNGSQHIEGIGLMENQKTFTLKAMPSLRLYRSADGNQDDPLADWRSFADHQEPSFLSDKVLVIGRGDNEPTHVGQLTPMYFDDVPPTRTVTLGELFEQQTGLDANAAIVFGPAPSTLYTDPGESINVQGLEIIASSRYLHTSGGIRRWELRSIRNDGLFHSNRSIEITGTDNEFLQLTGRGRMIFQGTTAIRAETLFNGEGHSLVFLGAEGLNISPELQPVRYQSPSEPGQDFLVTVPSVTSDDRPLKVTRNIQNAGTIRFSETNATVALGSELANGEFANGPTGTLRVDGGSAVTLITPRIVQDGLVAVNGLNSVLQITGSTIITTEGTTGTFEAAGGGYLKFLASPQNPTKIGEEISVDFNDPPPEKSLTFRAASGGEIEFFPAIEQRFDVRSRFETEPGGIMRLNGLSFPEIGVGNTENHAEYTEAASQFIEVTNRGTLIVESGRNNLFLDPADGLVGGEPVINPPEPFVVPINLVNEGTVRIEAGAEFGFQVEIQDYAEGGAKLAGGTWELIGANTRGSNLEVPPDADENEPLDPNLAVLNIEVVKVSDGDNILGNTFNIGDFDTKLTVNAANVKLSGRAVFPYFNSVRENEGVINLDNYVFHTEGDLVNRGEIRMTNSQLVVDGALTIDEGNLTADSTSLLSTNVLGAPISVIGGSLTLPGPTGSTPTSFERLVSRLHWVVREKGLGEDEDGNDVILPSRVDLGEARIRTIDSGGNFLLDGAQASMDSLTALRNILGGGTLTLTGGNELRLAHLSNLGTINLGDGGKLYVGDMQTDGQLNVGSDSYLDVTGTVITTAGAIHLDGIFRAASLLVDRATVISGTGHFVGDVDNYGTVSPGNSPGTLQVTGDYTQSADATLAIDIDGFVGNGPMSDQLLVSGNAAVGGFVGGNATLDGFLDVSLTDGFALREGQQFTILAARQLLDNGLELVGSAADYFDMFVVSGLLGRVVLQFRGGDFTLPGDYNDDGTVDAADYVVWRKTEGQTGAGLAADGDGNGEVDAGDYALWRAYFGATAANGPALSSAEPLSATVPEPATLTLIILSAFAVSLRRRHVTHVLENSSASDTCQ